MPNLNNIESPITLIAPARAGTSLVSNLFERHPQFEFVGETINLIFGIWRSVEYSSTDIRPLFQNSYWVSNDERVASVVRQAFLTCFPDDKPYWFHKPIGVPTVLNQKFSDTEWDEAAEWYWKVMRTTFPKAKYLTILRHPCDLVLSAQSKWGYDQGSLWWSLGLLAHLLSHSASPVEYAIHYQDLFVNQENVARALFQYAQVPFQSEVLEAFSKVHAPSQGREQLNQISAIRRSEWEHLDPANILPQYVDAIERLYCKFGYALEWPNHFINSPKRRNVLAPAGNAEQVEDSTATITRLTNTILTLNHDIERLHETYGRKIYDRERNVYHLWDEQRNWIANLEKVNAWLEEQRRNWQSEAERRGGMIRELQLWIAELEKGKAWLEEQRRNWQSEAERRGDMIKELQR